MKYISYREPCFPNCAKLWLIKLLSQVLGEAIAPITSPGSAHASVSLYAQYFDMEQLSPQPVRSSLFDDRADSDGTQYNARVIKQKRIER